jgi:hypothetical protein
MTFVLRHGHFKFQPFDNHVPETAGYSPEPFYSPKPFMPEAFPGEDEEDDDFLPNYY